FYDRTTTDAARNYDYQLDSAKKTFAVKNGTTNVSGLGQKAFVFKWDSSTGKVATWELWVLDSNLTYQFKLQGTRNDANWTEEQSQQVLTAMTASAKATIAKLAPS